MEKNSCNNNPSVVSCRDSIWKIQVDQSNYNPQQVSSEYGHYINNGVSYV